MSSRFGKYNDRLLINSTFKYSAHHFIVSSFTLVLLGLSPYSLARVDAVVDRNQIAAGETIQLILKKDGQTQSQPDLSGLHADFDILGSRSGSNIQMINGKFSANVELRLTLSPKKEGKLTIPAIPWDNEFSEATYVDVQANSSPSTQSPSQPATQAAPNSATNTSGSGTVQSTFIRLLVDQNQPYVQSGFILTIRIYTRVPLQQASLEVPTHPDLVMHRIGKDKEYTEQNQQQETFDIIERRYLVFPQRSGKIQLESPILNAQIQDSRRQDTIDPIFGHTPFSGFFQTFRPIRVRAKPLEIHVRPRPSQATGALWLPAQQLTLKEQWNPDTATIHAGEPITRHITLDATGLPAAQLPDLAKIMPLPDGLKAYPDQIKQENREIAGGTVPNLIGHREQDIAIIAQKPGHYSLPAFRIQWWDTISQRMQETTLPARTLIVEADAITASTPNAIQSSHPGSDSLPPLDTHYSPQPTTVSSSSSLNTAQTFNSSAIPWPWISSGLGILWIATLCGWRMHYQQIKRTHLPESYTEIKSMPTHSSASRKASEKAVKQACVERNPILARQALLAWSKQVWPDSPPIGMHQLLQRIESNIELKTSLLALDEACYGQTTTWTNTQFMDYFPFQVTQVEIDSASLLKNIWPKQKTI
jgi:BatD DUF11 like domain